LNDLARWIDGRRPPAPPSLHAAMLHAVATAEPDEEGVARSGEDAIAERLAAAGLHALTRVAAVPSRRAHALDLLAADALLTYACEAALDEDSPDRPGPVDAIDAIDAIDPVERLLDALDLVSFARIMDGEATG
jgi:hypothetical protein